MYNWYQAHKFNRTAFEKVEDAIANFTGSRWFLLIHIVWFAVWVTLPVEPFPFGFLTMIVSLEAILLSTIIMMSQQRSGERDRAQAQHDYQTNVAAKEEIEALQRQLARMEEEKLDMLISNGEQMNKMLDTIALHLQIMKSPVSVERKHVKKIRS